MHGAGPATRPGSALTPHLHPPLGAPLHLPPRPAQVCIFVPIVYFLVGFKATFEAFAHYFVMTTLVLYYYIVFGQFLTWATPSQQLAQVAGSSVNFIM